MRTLILTLLLIGVAVGAVLMRPKTCKGDDCNYGEPCYTHSQCECSLRCKKIPGDNPFGNKACQF